MFLASQLVFLSILGW